MQKASGFKPRRAVVLLRDVVRNESARIQEHIDALEGQKRILKGAASPDYRKVQGQINANKRLLNKLPKY